MEHVQVEVMFTASTKMQKQLLTQGKDASKVQKIIIKDSKLLGIAKICSAGRATIDLTGNYVRPRWFVSSEIKNEKEIAVVKKGGSSIQFDKIPSAEDILNLFIAPDMKTELAEYQKKLDEKAEANKKRKAEQAEADKKRKAEQAEADKKNALMEKERAHWISQHGSERLKMMFAGEYELRATYEQERGAIEFPDATYDVAGEKYDWKDRGNPSGAALRIESELLKKHDNVKIVWIISDNEDALGYEDSPGYEAVRVYPSWSRHAFVFNIAE